MPIFPTGLETQPAPKVPSPELGGTVDDDGGRGAPAFGHNVLGHAGVIGSVQQPGLLDDEVVIDGDQEVGVLGGIDDILVPQPLHLVGREEVGIKPSPRTVMSSAL